MAKQVSKKTNPQSTKSKRSTQVPDQFLGYSLQTTRSLARLLEANPGTFVSVEVFDDVGVVDSSGHKVAEQDKSTADGNPVSDRSVQLWKTFSNWMDAVKAGELDIDHTSFEIWVSRRVTGDIVQQFSDAQSLRDAITAIRKAREKLWGPPPNYPLRTAVSEGIREYLTNVFNRDENEFGRIIENFRFSWGTGNSREDLELLIGQKWVAPEIVSNVLNYALGWVKGEIDRLLEQKRPAIISRDRFFLEMTTYVRKVDRRQILESFAGAVTDEDVKRDLRLRVYVRQLELINSDDEQKIEAVKDFLLASVDRTRWSEKGFVNATSFDDFEDNLRRTWRNTKQGCDIEANDKDDVAKGRLLYSRCLNHRAKLEGLEVPNHFTPGSFHAISDAQTIGWHPDYKNKLKAVAKSR